MNKKKTAATVVAASSVITVLLAIVLVIAICVTVWAIFFRKDVLPPDYPPQNTDQNQQPLPDDPGGQIQTPAGGGAVNITYSEKVTIDLSDKQASLYYANPSRSTQNGAIAIVIGDEVILRSELITPGNMVTTLPLASGADKKLAVGVYDAELVVYCYDTVTGEKAMVDTRGAVELTVVQ